MATSHRTRTRTTSTSASPRTSTSTSSTRSGSSATSANDPDDPDDPKYSPLRDDELKVLAEWMDRGGGVFATGDHWNLGASMCSRIPRVRTMRKWTVDQGVPPQHGPTRHETTQGLPGVVTGYEHEEDTVPQPIEPVYRPTATSIAIRNYVPHPLLCAATA